MEIFIRPALVDEADNLTRIAFAAKRHWQYPEAWIKLWSDELTITGDYALWLHKQYSKVEIISCNNSQ